MFWLKVILVLMRQASTDSITHKRESQEISKSNTPCFEGCKPPRNVNKVFKDGPFNHLKRPLILIYDKLED